MLGRSNGRVFDLEVIVGLREALYARRVGFVDFDAHDGAVELLLRGLVLELQNFLQRLVAVVQVLEIYQRDSGRRQIEDVDDETLAFVDRVDVVLLQKLLLAALHLHVGQKQVKGRDEERDDVLPVTENIIHANLYDVGHQQREPLSFEIAHEPRGEQNIEVRDRPRPIVAVGLVCLLDDEVDDEGVVDDFARAEILQVLLDLDAEGLREEECALHDGGHQVNA